MNFKTIALTSLEVTKRHESLHYIPIETTYDTQHVFLYSILDNRRVYPELPFANRRRIWDCISELIGHLISRPYSAIQDQPTTYEPILLDLLFCSLEWTRPVQGLIFVLRQ